jgi:cupin superfamily acireductone dioxygenase involved in methionine salvage
LQATEEQVKREQLQNTFETSIKDIKVQLEAEDSQKVQMADEHSKLRTQLASFLEQYVLASVQIYLLLLVACNVLFKV